VKTHTICDNDQFTSYGWLITLSGLVFVRLWSREIVKVARWSSLLCTVKCLICLLV